VADTLVIDGTSVITQELLDRAELMRELALESFALRSRLAGLDQLLSMSWLQAVGAPVEAGRAEHDIDQARIVMAEIEAYARGLQWALGTAADGYAWAERFAGSLGQQFAGGLAAIAGRLAPGLLLSGAGAAALAAAGGVAVGASAAPGGPRGTLDRATAGTPGGGGTPDWLERPATVDLIRGATQNLGAFALGVTGLPTELVTALAGSGAGVAFAAGGAMRAGSMVGLLDETPVRLAGTSTSAVAAAPAGFAERFARIPDTDETDGAQVVIERYQAPGEPDRFEVYIAGTVTFSPVADGEPWDMTSNLANAAGYGGGSYASVTTAMHEAGITADSPVQFTGYSQGGGTAARLAASGEWNTQGLATFGGPTGQIRVPDGIPTVIVEHRDDLVPALGGVQLNLAAVRVEREVFAEHEAPPDLAVPAHHAQYYAQTAQLMDRESNPRLTEAVASLDRFGAGATTVTSTAYRFERVPEGQEISSGRGR
jgi:hypothetical protein